MRLPSPTLDALRRHTEAARHTPKPIGLWEFIRTRVRDVGISATGKPTQIPEAIIFVVEGLLQVNPTKRWSTARAAAYLQESLPRK